MRSLSPSVCLLLLTYLTGWHSLPCLAAEEAEATIVTKSVVLDPAIQYGRLVIAASDITIDGAGILLNGPGGPPNKRSITAIESTGQARVTLKNIKASGWETGLHIVDGDAWLIENCDFSDNFHDPDFGWGENGRRGGIVLEGTKNCIIRNNKANRVWDACVLVGSDSNQIENNDFSRSSNTCLKMWQACKNVVRDNNLSYGIRINPGEVHARDSTSVLIESGSNDNQFFGNDCTHGGDGIFIRVLNGWCSTGNYFEQNDCSYANNNGFECWAPRNIFVRNKANHCSYGFWMGGSDQSRLEFNEANYNGLPTGQHNSPHLPQAGHAGIVFMFGPSSHIMVRGNKCVGNNGAGVALVGDVDSRGQRWKAYHWLIDGNDLRDNRWGIYARFADWIRVVGNDFRGNVMSDVFADESVSRLEVVAQSLVEINAKPTASPPYSIVGPKSSRAGEEVLFRCQPDESDAARYFWDLGDGTISTVSEVRHIFKKPGFYRVGVNLRSNKLEEIAYRDFYVVPEYTEIADKADSWGIISEPNLDCQVQVDRQNFVAGADSVKVTIDPYHGSLARLLYPLSKDANWSIEGISKLGFWIKAVNPNMPGWQSNNPEIALYSDDDDFLRLTPKRDLFGDSQYNEARDGWRFIEIPLNADEAWQREGNMPTKIQYITIGVDSWDSQPLQIWIDGVVFW